MKGLVAGSYTFELTHTTVRSKVSLERLAVRFIKSNRQTFVEVAGSRVEIFTVTHYKPPNLMAGNAAYPWKNTKVVLATSPDTYTTLHVSALKDHSDGVFISKIICPPAMGKNARWEINLDDNAKLIFSGDGHKTLEITSTSYSVQAIYATPNIKLL